MSVLVQYTLPETNKLHLKIDGWETTFLLGWPIFKGYISFRESKLHFAIVPTCISQIQVVGLVPKKKLSSQKRES